MKLLKSCLAGLAILLLATLSALGSNVLLKWNPSTDPGGLAIYGYNVYRNGVKIGTSPTTNYTDTTAQPGTTYSYTVTAVDLSGNESGQSTVPSITTAGGGGGFEKPGPSQALFNNPYYTCVRNFYIATTGSDNRTTAQAQSQSTPWLTMQHANDSAVLQAGDCVNVLPGTYAQGVQVNHGGSSATSGGYVVYRCTVMDACIVTDVGTSFGAMSVVGNPGVNYVMFDGFTLTGNSAAAYGIGYQANQTPGHPAPSSFCCHHIWFLNSIVSGYGQSGFQGGLSDFIYVIHNTFFNNATVTCDAQGSGISMVWPQVAAGYVLVADDKNNSVTGNLASQGDWFHQVYNWNITYNNHMNPACGNSNTDGNGIIMDTFNGSGTGGPGVYLKQTLISFNVSYNNGGKGIHLFLMDTSPGHAGLGVTVANNSAYNNNLDTTDTGTTRYEIGEQQGSNDTFVNNTVYTIRATGSCSGSAPLTCNFPMIGDSSGGLPSHFSNNVAICTVGSGCADVSTAMFNGAVWTSGKGNNDPLWVNVGRSSAGTETTQPVGHNFTICTASGNASGCTGVSPALGYLLTETFIPTATRDSGACDRSLVSCP